MLSRSLMQMIKGRWREFLREPSAFFWVVLMPVLWMVGLGFAFSKPKPEHYGVGWSTQSQGVFAEQVHQMLKTDPQIKLREGPASDMLQKFQRGDIVVVLSVTDKIGHFQLDPVNPEAQRARSYVNQKIQELGGRVDTVLTEVSPIQAQGGRYVDFLIPGLLGLSIMSSSLFGVGMTIVANRKDHLLKRYMATPMSGSEYIVSHIIGRFFVLTVEFFAVMLAGFAIFRFHVYGSFAAFVALSILGAASFTAIALLCASRTSSIPTISGITNLISLPMMVLSGVFFSKSNFPDWMQDLVHYLPLTALNDGLRKIALEGQSFGAITTEMAVLSVYLVICAVLARVSFRWY